MANHVMEEAFVNLASEAKDLFVPSRVDRLSVAPTPLTFLRRYVMANVPVVIANGCSHWPAVKLWTDEYLIKRLGDKKLSVALTPNGYADATSGEHFVLPHEEKMMFSEFLKHLGRKSGDVPYIQRQNSSLTEEFAELISDVELEIPWASEAFAKQPDAINFWMGGERSVTSMHKDHYENLYAVVRGRKTFLLQPPTDLGCIPYEEYTVARYFRDELGKYDIIKERSEQHCEGCPRKSDRGDIDVSRQNHSENTDTDSDSSLNCSCVRRFKTVPWISIDPLKPDLTKYPLYKHTTQLSVTLDAGDVLYLPSLWFHHVRQSDDTIAVNFWYDMEYDIKYSYYRFVENIKDRLTNCEISSSRNCKSET